MELPPLLALLGEEVSNGLSWARRVAMALTTAVSCHTLALAEFAASDMAQAVRPL